MARLKAEIAFRRRYTNVVGSVDVLVTRLTELFVLIWEKQVSIEKVTGFDF